VRDDDTPVVAFLEPQASVSVKRTGRYTLSRERERERGEREKERASLQQCTFKQYGSVTAPRDVGLNLVAQYAHDTSTAPLYSWVLEQKAG
jgi:hypothetical protein